MKKNRELRIQLKSLISDDTSPGKKSKQTVASKRKLMKDKDALLRENDALLLKFKKAFILS